MNQQFREQHSELPNSQFQCLSLANLKFPTAKLNRNRARVIQYNNMKKKKEKNIKTWPTAIICGHVNCVLLKQTAGLAPVETWRRVSTFGIGVADGIR